MRAVAYRHANSEKYTNTHTGRILACAGEAEDAEWVVSISGHQEAVRHERSPVLSDPNHGLRHHRCVFVVGKMRGGGRHAGRWREGVVVQNVEKLNRAGKFLT